MSRRHALVLGCFLAGCSLQTSLNGGPSTPRAPGHSDPDREREAAAEWHGQQGQSNLDASNFLRAEFEALAGLTVDKARAQAKARGHTGEIKVADDLIEVCQYGVVCTATDERGGQSGMSNSETLVLHINKQPE